MNPGREKVLEGIARAFEPFHKQLKRAISREDILKLTDKPVRRIYKLDIEELNDQIKGLRAEIKQVKHELNNLVDYASLTMKTWLKNTAKARSGRRKSNSSNPFKPKKVAIAIQGYMSTGQMGLLVLD
jgi:topoisomerase-4 subunit A